MIGSGGAGSGGSAGSGDSAGSPGSAGSAGSAGGQPFRTVVEGIPVVAVPPADGAGSRPIALWLPPFTQSKDSTLPVLQELADAGFVAISLDPLLHGERAVESVPGLAERVFRPGNFRRAMWPILGQTVLDAVRVLDWAFREYGGAGVPAGAHAGARTAVAGGLSMGGDIAVALAGIDTRVTRVAAIVATPDWTRPGMRAFRPPHDPVDQGEADAYASWFYRTLDPISHLDRYRRSDLAIAFECAANDSHVPPDGALNFRDALLRSSPGGVAEDVELSGHAAGPHDPGIAMDGPRIRVTLHRGRDHASGSADPVIVRRCLEWLRAP